MSFTPPETTLKPWGKEEKWAHTEDYVGKFLHVTAGHRLSLQYHEEKEETMCVISGKVILTYGKEGDIYTNETFTKEMCVGDTVHLKPRTIHRIEAVEDAVVVEVSTPQLQDVVRLYDDYKRVN